ncbi:MAG: glycosyltransferase family 4 protein [Opitutales bacterium]|nr:glycosyltransferase family 4 protein [Opitutales bacterium]
MPDYVALNTRCLRQPTTGVQRYASEIAKRIAYKVEVTPTHSLFFGGILGHLWEQCFLFFVVRERLLFSPANSGPLLHPNLVITIHDAATLDHPEWFSKSFALWYRFLVPRLLKQGKAIITVSQASKDRLAYHVPSSRNKIHVVHNGIGENFCRKSSIEVNQVKAKFEISGRYFLYVGSIEPRKNLTTLLSAWEKVWPQLDATLILAGGALDRVFSEGNQLKVPAGVKGIGRFEDDDLPALYSGSVALVYPSLYEGFGFPILETMRCGGIPIFSSIPSHIEITADMNSEDLFSFQPLDSDVLSRIMIEVVRLPAERRALLGEKYQCHAEQFTWERCAQATSDIIENLLK